jgi:transcriptional regulator with XRE-family HTH domain
MQAQNAESVRNLYLLCVVPCYLQDVTGDIVKAWRKHKGFTQTDLAVAARMSLSTIQKIEANAHEVPRPTIRGLCEALGRTLEEYDAEVERRSAGGAAARGEGVKYDQLGRDWRAVLEEAKKHGLSPQQVREAIQRTRPRNQGQGS